jgi:hypothetical protein
MQSYFDFLRDSCLNLPHAHNTLFSGSEIRQEEVKIVRNEITGFRFVPHLDEIIPDDALDGKKMWFIKGKKRGSQVFKDLEIAELVEKFKKVFTQGLVK